MDINNEDLFIERCFKILEKRKPEKFFNNTIKENTTVVSQLIKSKVSKEDIVELENTFNIKLPSLYKCFISSYCYNFTKLEAIVDNFMFEDDREIFVDIIPQNIDDPLDDIREVYEQHYEIMEFGYIPIADLNSCGPLCFDTKGDYELVWLDHEEYFQCESREALEAIAVPIFKDFRTFMEAFFCGEKCKCEDM